MAQMCICKENIGQHRPPANIEILRRISRPLMVAITEAPHVKIVKYNLEIYPHVLSR